MIMKALPLTRFASLIVAGLAAAGGASLAGKRSGFEFMSPATQTMQRDETANPGMLWVLDGSRLWNEGAGETGVACGACHGDAGKSMRGVSARYPMFEGKLGRAIDLTGRINQCRAERQGAEPLDPESQELLALTAFVAHQSKGLPITPPVDDRLTPARERGNALFRLRMGQLNLSCASCHDDHADRTLGGSPITQGQPNAYPLYRLEWQSLGSLQRRIRGCMVGVRAEPFAFGAPEMIELELFLMSRAEGLLIETPGVRP